MAEIIDVKSKPGPPFEFETGLTFVSHGPMTLDT